MKEPSTYLTRHKKGSANMTLRIPTGGMVFSIGYEGRTLQELLKLLEVYRVDLVVDVRENPISRKPGFNRRQLSAALQSAGIDYRHEPLLGNPKENREAFQRGHLAAGRKRYFEHLNNGSRAAYEEIVELAFSLRLVLLCFERDEERCHRSCLLQQAKADHPALAISRL